jgi:hypothetical protein
VRHFGTVEAMAAAATLQSTSEFASIVDGALHGVRISRANITKSLCDPEAMRNAILFKQILALRDDVPMRGINTEMVVEGEITPAEPTHLDALNGLPRIRQSRLVASARKTLQGSRLLSTSDFKFLGEELNVVPALESISSSLLPVLDSFRQLYSKMNRFES